METMGSRYMSCGGNYHHANCSLCLSPMPPHLVKLTAREMSVSFNIHPLELDSNHAHLPQCTSCNTVPVPLRKIASHQVYQHILSSYDVYGLGDLTNYSRNVVQPGFNYTDGTRPAAQHHSSSSSLSGNTSETSSTAVPPYNRKPESVKGPVSEVQVKDSLLAVSADTLKTSSTALPPYNRIPESLEGPVFEVQIIDSSVSADSLESDSLVLPFYYRIPESVEGPVPEIQVMDSSVSTSTDTWKTNSPVPSYNRVPESVEGPACEEVQVMDSVLSVSIDTLKIRSNAPYNRKPETVKSPLSEVQVMDSSVSTDTLETSPSSVLPLYNRIRESAEAQVPEIQVTDSSSTDTLETTSSALPPYNKITGDVDGPVPEIQVMDSVSTDTSETSSSALPPYNRVLESVEDTVYEVQLTDFPSGKDKTPEDDIKIFEVSTKKQQCATKKLDKKDSSSVPKKDDNDESNGKALQSGMSQSTLIPAEDEDDEDTPKEKYHKMRRKNGKMKKEFKGELRKKQHEKFLAAIKPLDEVPSTSSKSCAKKKEEFELKKVKPKMVGKIKLEKQCKQAVQPNDEACTSRGSYPKWKDVNGKSNKNKNVEVKASKETACEKKKSTGKLPESASGKKECKTTSTTLTSTKSCTVQNASDRHLEGSLLKVKPNRKNLSEVPKIDKPHLLSEGIQPSNTSKPKSGASEEKETVQTLKDPAESVDTEVLENCERFAMMAQEKALRDSVMEALVQDMGYCMEFMDMSLIIHSVNVNVYREERAREMNQEPEVLLKKHAKEEIESLDKLLKAEPNTASSDKQDCSANPIQTANAETSAKEEQPGVGDSRNDGSKKCVWMTKSAKKSKKNRGGKTGATISRENNDKNFKNTNVDKVAESVSSKRKGNTLDTKQADELENYVAIMTVTNYSTAIPKSGNMELAKFLKSADKKSGTVAKEKNRPVKVKSPRVCPCQNYRNDCAHCAARKAIEKLEASAIASLGEITPALRGHSMCIKLCGGESSKGFPDCALDVFDEENVLQAPGLTSGPKSKLGFRKIKIGSGDSPKSPHGIRSRKTTSKKVASASTASFGTFCGRKILVAGRKTCAKT